MNEDRQDEEAKTGNYSNSFHKHSHYKVVFLYVRKWIFNK